MLFFSRTVKDDFGRALRTRGELWKKGGSRSSFGGRRNWQKRFFSLDLDRGELRYFEDDGMNVQKGLVQMTPSTEIRQKELFFEMKRCLDDRGAQRDAFLVKADTPQELEEWLTSLHYSLKLVRESHNQISIDDLQRPSLVEKNNKLVVAELAHKLKDRGTPSPQFFSKNNREQPLGIPQVRLPSTRPEGFVPPPPPPRRQQTV